MDITTHESNIFFADKWSVCPGARAVYRVIVTEIVIVLQSRIKNTLSCRHLIEFVQSFSISLSIVVASLQASGLIQIAMRYRSFGQFNFKDTRIMIISAVFFNFFLRVILYVRL